ncbi:MAG: Na+/H+ antiporter NhaA [Actinomycetia bacterium]|nr:Na+/H+ antiporter NhaA [Actinomycetes bacterium]
MALFFFVVGLEIKRELVDGELRDRRVAALPALAALGGMVVPALLYLAWTAGSSAQRGWGIPMATDIAFAVGVLALLGARASTPLKLFVLTLAVVDDIGAIVVIAIFYARDFNVAWLAGALGVVAIIVLLRRFATRPIIYVLPAIVLWVCVHESGVHPTIAGVALGLLTPTHTSRATRPALQLEHRLDPVASFMVVPLFALANAGIRVTAESLHHAATSAVAWGVLVGLVVGKFLGVFGATTLGERLHLGRLPDRMTRRDLAGGAAVAGIGFTVALFVASLAFDANRQYLTDAKLAILLASVVAALFATVVLTTTASRHDASGKK